MPVRLDKVPAPAVRPRPPRTWLWLLLLPMVLLAGVGLLLLLGWSMTLSPARFWTTAIGAPLAFWSVLCLVRWLVFGAQHLYADSWDARREEVWERDVQRGRRLLQVWAVSLHSALRDADAVDGQAQLAALLERDSRALKNQPTWQTDVPPLRHSRLPFASDESPELILRRVLSQALAELAIPLAELPGDWPLMVLFEPNSALPDSTIKDLFAEVLDASGIRQAVTPLTGSGWAVVDQWLDQRFHERSLLLVVAAQVAPEQVDGSAESVVALLLGGLPLPKLSPVARMYRPEREREAGASALSVAILQTMQWARLPAERVEHLWLAGIAAERRAGLTASLQQAELRQPLDKAKDLDACLGQSRALAPWLALAAASEAARQLRAPQLLITADHENALWCTAIGASETPA